MASCQTDAGPPNSCSTSTTAGTAPSWCGRATHLSATSPCRFGEYCLRCDIFAPHYTTPHHTILYHTIPYHIPYHTIPYHSLPYLTTPFHTIPHRTPPHHTSPHHTIPYYTIPHHIPYYSIPYHTTPYHTIPYHTAPYHATPYRSTPHHTMFRSTPYHAKPHHIPYHSIPHHTISYFAMPHHTITHHYKPLQIQENHFRRSTWKRRFTTWLWLLGEWWVMFWLVARRKAKVQHCRIKSKQENGQTKYYLVDQVTFDSLYSLINHYQAHPLKSMNFELTLSEAIPQVREGGREGRGWGGERERER